MKATYFVVLLCGLMPAFCQMSFPEPRGSDETGFEPIFDGQTLKGCEADTKLWRAEGGVLIGQITPETLLKQNSFIIWRGGSTRNFHHLVRSTRLDSACRGNFHPSVRSHPRGTQNRSASSNTHQ